MLTSALVTIASVNFDSVVDFYTKFLESTPVPYIPNVYAEFSLSGLRLGIFCPKASHQSCFGVATPTESSQPSPSAMSLCLEVASLENSIDTLTLLGYPPPGEITTASHGREIYAYDPDGNRLILHQSHGR
jgi:predicted enzyme related to lactoylglutathione lyase